MTRLKLALFIGILIVGAALRLYRFDNPIADWHSWRQADTSSVSREFVKNGFDILHPKYHDLSPHSKDALPNPNGYRFVEFPIYNLLQGGAFVAADFLSLEGWGRVLSIFSSVAAAIFIFLLLKKHASLKAAFFGAFFYLFLPFNIYWGRSILPDPMAIASLLGGVYFFDVWIDSKKKSQFLLAAFFIASAILLKPFTIFFTLPILYLAWNEFRLSAFRKWQLWLFAFICILPFAAWRIWMSGYPEGIPDNRWLLNGGNIRFSGAFFYWLFADRIGRLILGYFGVALFIIGFLRKFDRNNLFFLSFVVSSLFYMVVFAKGNVNHDYYQILIAPSLVFFMALGADFLLEQGGKLFPKIVGYSVILVCSVFSLMFGWYFVRDYFNINNPSIVVAGKAANRILPKDAKVLAPYQGDTALLYQTERKGWPIWTLSMSEMVNNFGATNLVIANPTPEDLELKNDYKTLEETAQYIIFDIRKGP